MRKIKKSVLKAFLFICLGLFIATVAIAAQFEPPGPPGRPIVVALDATSCELEYLAPLSDGGARILGYYIEYRYVGASKWTKLNRSPHPELKFRAHSITEGKQIEFRVIAVNKAGEGKPSIPCDPVTPMNPRHS